MDDISRINFLGSGFPCFYNYILYCMFMLILLFAISGCYNLITNYLGNNCLTPDEDLALAGGIHSIKDYKEKEKMEEEKKHHSGEEEGGEAEKEEKSAICHYNWAHIFSMANKMGHDEFIEPQEYLNLIVGIIVMVCLMYFRKSQRYIDKEVDVQFITPSDYALIVKNVPKDQSNYEHHLRYIFNFIINNPNESHFFTTENLNKIAA